MLISNKKVQEIRFNLKKNIESLEEKDLKFFTFFFVKFIENNRIWINLIVASWPAITVKWLNLLITII